MEIVLLILKIIGIVLLCVLGFVLCLLAMVLFVPIRYGIDASYYQKPDINASVSWLLRIVSVNCRITKDTKNLIVRIFGIPIMDLFHPKEKKEPKNKKEKKNSLKKETEIKKDASLINEAHTEKNVANAPETTEGQKEKTETTEAAKEETKEATDNRKKKKISFESLVHKAEATKEKADDVKKQAEKWVAVLKEEETKQALLKCKDVLIKLLKKILPRKWNLRIRFGFKDPATTSEILGYYWMFIGIFQQHIICIPDYENEVIEGDLKAKGYIQIITFLLVALKLLFDPDFKYIRNIKAKVDAME